MGDRVDRTGEVADLNPDAVVLDGWGDCIIGMTSDGAVVYDHDLMVDKMVEQGSKHTEAVDHIGYNVEGVLPNIHEFRPVIISLFHD